MHVTKDRVGQRPKDNLVEVVAKRGHVETVIDVEQIYFWPTWPDIKKRVAQEGWQSPDGGESQIKIKSVCCVLLARFLFVKLL